MQRTLLAAMAILVAAPVHSSEHGCKVLLCLANPSSNGGPRGLAECEPTIDKLYRDLSKGRSFPECEEAGSAPRAAYARRVFDPYDPCPAPLVPAVPGTRVVQGRRADGGSNSGLSAAQAYVLDAEVRISESGLQQDATQRACVGARVGTYFTREDTMETVDVYERVEWQAWQNPHAFDLYIDGSLYKRVRQ